MSNLDDDEVIASGIRRRIQMMSPPSTSDRRWQTLRSPSDTASTSIGARNVAPVALALVAVVAVVGTLAFRAATTHQDSSTGLNAVATETGTAEPFASVVAAPPTSNPSGVGPSVGPSQGQMAAVKLPGPVFNLCFDRSRHSLWYVYLADRPTLYEYSIATEKTSTWPLPPGEDSGSLNRVALAPDGAVWVVAGYRIVRVDPVSGALTTHTFAVADPDANAAALDPNSSSPGTWVSAIAFDGSGNALIGRHNVGSLARMDAALNVVDRIPMPVSVAGPSDLAYLNGIIYVAPAHPGTGLLLSEKGETLATTSQPVSMFGVSGNTVATLGSEGLGRVTSNGAVSAWGPAHENSTPLDRWTLTPDGAAVYRYNPGVIEWIGPDGRVVGSLNLPGSTVLVVGPAGDKGPVYQQDQVGALASDSAGSVWYTDATANQLIHVQLQ